MLPARVRSYLVQALEGAPLVFELTLRGLTEAEADRRPDPDRFTIREVMAHLADWETVFAQRLLRTRDEDRPLLPGYDEGQWAIDHDYARTDWRRSLVQFAGRRAELAAILRAPAPAEWDRAAEHSEIGPITLGESVTLISAHDGYHLHQVAAWRLRDAG